MNIALISGTGVIVAAGGELVQRLRPTAAALLIGAIVFFPAVIFLFMPALGQTVVWPAKASSNLTVKSSRSFDAAKW